MDRWKVADATKNRNGLYNDGTPFAHLRSPNGMQQVSAFRAMAVGTAWIWGFILLVAGCNTSRYGTAYDHRLSQIRTVAVVPVSVDVFSLHSGGLLEARPDESARVAARAVATVAGIVRERGRSPKPLNTPAADPGRELAFSQDLAFLSAVRDAIVTHHYEHGKNLVFDYEVGNAAADLATDEVDAVLCVYIKAAIPTGGRSMLKATAIAVGLVTGIHIQVKTKEILILAMLVDRASGQVLWFNQYLAEATVTDEGDLGRALNKACAYMLKPREGR
jgi:hypothetical protein